MGQLCRLEGYADAKSPSPIPADADKGNGWGYHNEARPEVRSKPWLYYGPMIQIQAGGLAPRLQGLPIWAMLKKLTNAKTARAHGSAAKKLASAPRVHRQLP